MIAIIGAMPQEVNEIVMLMHDVKEITQDGRIFHQGKLNGTEVVVTLSGIGKVEAAMSTLNVILRFPIDGIVNIGTAGGLNANQEVLDVVVSTKTAYHDFDLTAFGEPKGLTSSRYVFDADEKYISAFKEVIGDQRHWIGPIVSGDQFISDPQTIEAIKASFPEAICVEMEGAAIAHVAAKQGIPFVILRSLSDIVLHHDNAMTFEEYLVKASKRSAQWCYEVMPKIGR